MNTTRLIPAMHNNHSREPDPIHNTDLGAIKIVALLLYSYLLVGGIIRLFFPRRRP